MDKAEKIIAMNKTIMNNSKELVDSLNTISERYFIEFSANELEKYKLVISNIFNGKNIEHNNDKFILNYLGLYYECVKKDYDLAEMYYRKSIEKGYLNAKLNLTCLFHFVKKDYDLAKQFYLEIIEINDDVGNVIDMMNFSNNFNNSNNNFNNNFNNSNNNFNNSNRTVDKKNNIIGDNFNNNIIGNIDTNILSLTYYGLAYLYQTIENDKGFAIQYYIKSIKLGCVLAVFKLKKITTPFELYNLLIIIKQPNDLVLKMLHDIKMPNNKYFK